MHNSGPELDSLTHWLTECPAEFYQYAVGNDGKNLAQPGIHVAAIVGDHLSDVGLAEDRIRQAKGSVSSANAAQQQLMSITVWLLRSPWFMNQEGLANTIAELLCNGLRDLADTIKPELAVTDPDRREELVRLCLNQLGFRPAGETVEQASDRLTTLDSVERTKIMLSMRAAEARARQIREEMARKRAQEAAARYSPE
ncbi:MAG: hypothetical protein R3C53_00330 [Pirellulaceae bacterium]